MTYFTEDIKHENEKRKWTLPEMLAIGLTITFIVLLSLALLGILDVSASTMFTGTQTGTTITLTANDQTLITNLELPEGTYYWTGSYTGNIGTSPYTDDWTWNGSYNNLYDSPAEVSIDTNNIPLDGERIDGHPNLYMCLTTVLKTNQTFWYLYDNGRMTPCIHFIWDSVSNKYILSGATTPNTDDINYNNCGIVKNNNGTFGASGTFSTEYPTFWDSIEFHVEYKAGTPTTTYATTTTTYWFRLPDDNGTQETAGQWTIQVPNPQTGIYRVLGKFYDLDNNGLLGLSNNEWFTCNDDTLSPFNKLTGYHTGEQLDAFGQPIITGTSTDILRRYFGNKIPFAYLYATKDTIDALSASTTAFAQVAITIPKNDTLKMPTTSMPFITSEYIFKIMPESTWTFIKSAFSLIIVISFIIYIGRRLRSFLQMGTDVD